GTFAKVLDKSLAVEDVHSASKSSKSTPEIEAEIREKLIQASSSKPQDTRATVKNIMAADEGPATEMKKSALGWEKFFEQDHDLRDLMALDPDDPSPELVPEWKELDDIDNAAENTMDTHLAVEDETLDKGV